MFLYIVLAQFTCADATHVAAEKCVNYKMLVGHGHTEGVRLMGPECHQRHTNLARIFFGRNYSGFFLVTVLHNTI